MQTCLAHHASLRLVHYVGLKVKPELFYSWDVSNCVKQANI